MIHSFYQYHVPRLTHNICVGASIYLEVLLARDFTSESLPPDLQSIPVSYYVFYFFWYDLLSLLVSYIFVCDLDLFSEFVIECIASDSR